MTSDNLQKHFLATYCTLRAGLAALAIALPFLLVGVGWYFDIPTQRSMSAYYFAFEPPKTELRTFPLRVTFVGILFALGAFLVLYRGYSRTENWALNVSGLSAFLVALFPTEVPDYCSNCGADTYVKIHYGAAVALFGFAGFVALTCSEETLTALPESSWKRTSYRLLYDLTAAVMLGLPVLSLLAAWYLDVFAWKILIVEFACIIAFGSYWLVKTVELCFDNPEVSEKS